VGRFIRKDVRTRALLIEDEACPPAVVRRMFTANSMNCLCEAIAWLFRGTDDSCGHGRSPQAGQGVRMKIMTLLIEKDHCQNHHDPKSLCQRSHVTCPWCPRTRSFTSPPRQEAGMTCLWRNQRDQQKDSESLSLSPGERITSRPGPSREASAPSSGTEPCRIDSRGLPHGDDEERGTKRQEIHDP